MPKTLLVAALAVASQTVPDGIVDPLVRIGTWAAIVAAIGTLASALAAAISARAAHKTVDASRQSNEYANEERAHRYLEDALTKLGGDPGSVFLLDVKIDPRDFVRAGQLIRLAIKAAPSLAWARIYYVAYLFHQGGQDKRALRESEAGRSCAADSEERVLVLNQRGILFSRMGDFTSADAAFTAALEQDVYRDTTWINKAWSLLSQNEPESALTAYQNAIDSNRFNLNAHKYRVDLLLQLGRSSEAARTWAALGNALVDAGDRRAAVYPLLQAEASSRNPDDWCDLKGRLLFLAGERADARDFLDRAITLGHLKKGWELQHRGGDSATPALPGFRRR